MTPFAVQDFLTQFPTVGVGGSRASFAPDATAAQPFVAFLIGRFRQVFTACSGVGVPSLVRLRLPHAVVFRAADFPGRAPFPRRAAALVAAVRQSAGAFVCFPGVPCPVGLRPSGSWVSCGSGSWSELSLAVGTGVSCLVFLPSRLSPPVGWGFELVCSDQDFGSWYSCVPSPVPSLF